MKKLTTVMLAAIAILTILFSFLPMSAVQAKKEPTDVNLRVRNQTGGTVSLKLVDENGNVSWYEYEPGQTTTPLPEGLYTYYASTPCGNQSGTFNLNITKELDFACKEGLEIALWRPSLGVAPSCSNYDWYMKGAKPYEWAPVGWTPMPGFEYPPGLEYRCTDGDPTYVVWYED